MDRNGFDELPVGFSIVLMRRLTAGMVGFVGLSLEIAYTRIISFKLFYYYTYFVIGLALLGFGAAATVVARNVATFWAVRPQSSRPFVHSSDCA